MQDQAQKVRANLKYLRLLAKDYPNIAEASSEIINLQAVLKLPKGTEHFMSDLHGEYDAFTHILNNASGVIKEKVDRALGPEVPDQRRSEFATLIYYPVQKLPELKKKQQDPGVADRGVPAGVFQAHPEICALQSAQGL